MPVSVPKQIEAMDIELIHPQLQNAYKRIPAIPFHNRFFLACMNFFSGLAPKAKTQEGVLITQFNLSKASIRVYQPERETSGAALLWMHGGGYITGHSAMNDRECIAYVKALKLLVVSVDYRLAPKHPYPAALDDCHEAWQWLIKNASEYGVDQSRIAISGQSAGAGLAASLSHKILDSDGIQPAAVALYYPMLDDRTGANTELDAIGHGLWNNKNNRAGWQAYLNRPLGEQHNDYGVPARRDKLDGLPPTWLGVGEADLFYQENLAYMDALTKAGVTCALSIAPKAPHAFDVVVPRAPITETFIKENYEFLKRTLTIL